MIDWNSVNNTLSDAVLSQDLLGELLVDLGCRPPSVFPGRRSIRLPCPVHGGDGPNLHIQTDGHALPIRWACRSQQCEKTWKPSLLGFVRGVLSTHQGKPVHPKIAADYLSAFLKGRGISTSPARRRPTHQRPTPKLLSLSRDQVRSRLILPSPFYVVKGFSPNVLDRHDVGHSAKERKTIVPLYSDDGNTCISFLARSEHPPCDQCKMHHVAAQSCRSGQPKWSTMAGFPKSEYLYNLAAVRRDPRPFLLVVEGPGDVWRAEEAGYPAVALLGTELFPPQMKKLTALGKEVFLALDNDQAGRDGMSRIVHEQHVKCRPLFVPPPYKDIGDMTMPEVTAWLLAHGFRS